MTRQSLIVLMGLPAAGKSTIAESFGLPVVSLDAIRIEGKSPGYVVSQCVRKVERMLGDGMPVVVDACNLQPQLRLRWLRLGRAVGARCELLVVETDRDLVLSRNRARPVGERVDDASMLRFIARWDASRARARGESWDRVRVVSGVEYLLDVRSREW
jgi:predicted kinase